MRWAVIRRSGAAVRGRPAPPRLAWWLGGRCRAGGRGAPPRRPGPRAAAGAPPAAQVRRPQLASQGLMVNYPARGAPEAAQGAGLRLRHRRRGHRPGARGQGPARQVRPASTLKVLTAITLIPVLNPDATVVTSHQAAIVEPNNVGLITGPQYQVSDLFKALLLISANDAAVRWPRPPARSAKGIAHDERRGAPPAGRRHGGQAAERAARHGPARLGLRRGAVRPAGPGDPGVHALRLAAVRPVPVKRRTR